MTDDAIDELEAELLAAMEPVQVVVKKILATFREEGRSDEEAISRAT